MGLIRFVVWTSLCIGFGVFLGSAEVGGKTPVQHLTRMIKQQSPRLEKVSDEARGAVDEVKKKVAANAATREVPAKGPSEQHSASDRDAIDQLIAKHHDAKSAN